MILSPKHDEDYVTMNNHCSIQMSVPFTKHFYVLTFFGFTAKNIDDTHLHVNTFFRYKPFHALITLCYLGKSASYCLNLGLTMSETGYESIW